MKKNNILLFLFVLILASCSSDDDSSVTDDTTDEGDSIDLIIGEWRLVEFLEDGVQLEMTGCELNDFIEFVDDNSILDTFFEPDSGDVTGCNQLVDDSGSWNRVSDNEYRIILDDGDLDYTAIVSFSENNTMHTQSYTLDDGGTFDIVATYVMIE